MNGYIGANRETESGFRSQIEAREDLLSHSGLLSQGGSDRAGFLHLSFQEFLAAEQLSRLNEGADKLLQIFLQRAEMPHWLRTLRFLLARRIAIQGLPPTLELLDKMLRSINPTCVSDRVGLALSVVDGLEILRELGPGFQLQNPFRDQFLTVCLKAIEQAVDVKPRASLAQMLGRIGDPRVASNLDQDAAWVTVEPGNYVFGDDNQPFRIDKTFGLSKFPVTNAQFAGFVREGYSDASFWHPTGWQWRCKSSINEPHFWNDAEWNGPTQPVVGISWWEADAFCRWAKVRLPTEHEWEAAARGPRGFVYPWSNEWQNGICNSFQCGLGKTSPVGIFPGSVAACGAHDMAGNVWEWCSDHYDPAEQKDDNASRVLRGGSWVVQADYCRSSIRDLNGPESRNIVVGFRVARTL